MEIIWKVKRMVAQKRGATACRLTQENTHCVFEGSRESVIGLKRQSYERSRK